jgi:hypothetical protein
MSGPFGFRSSSWQRQLFRIDFASPTQPTTQPGIMSEHGSDKNTSPPGYDMKRPCEEILQNLSDGRLTAAEAAPKLSAITVPDPNIDPEEYEEHLQELWAILLEFLESPGPSKDGCRSYLVHRASASRSHPTGRAAGCRRWCPACLAGFVNSRVGTSRRMALWALPCPCFLNFSRAAMSDCCHQSAYPTTQTIPRSDKKPL